MNESENKTSTETPPKIEADNTTNGDNEQTNETSNEIFLSSEKDREVNTYDTIPFTEGSTEESTKKSTLSLKTIFSTISVITFFLRSPIIVFTAKQLK